MMADVLVSAIVITSVAVTVWVSLLTRGSHRAPAPALTMQIISDQAEIWITGINN